MTQLISIIIPTYNRYNIIGKTIESIIDQTFTNWECIVIDDGSSDFTVELLEFYCNSDARIKFFHRPPNVRKGPSACRNYGFEISKGDYINWFDSDDLMHPNFLQQKLSSLQNRKETVCSISTFFTFKFEQKKIIYLEESLLGPINIFEKLCTHQYVIPTHGPLWKRKFLLNKKLFNENLTMSEDLEFHSRNLPPDAQIVVLNQPLYFLRRGHESITSGFYLNMSKHFNSYFFVRKQIIKKYSQNKVICDYYKNELMSVFRFLLVLKDFRNAKLILNFVEHQLLPKTFKKKMVIMRIGCFLNMVKLLGRGETKFKRYFYLTVP